MERIENKKERDDCSYLFDSLFLCQTAEVKSDEDLLHYYNAEWQRYIVAMKYADRIFRYLVCDKEREMDGWRDSVAS
jgi:hypothetical protein